VHVCSSRASSIAGSSRYAAASYRVADPLKQPAKFADEIAGLAAGIGADVLLPVSEAALLAILPNRERFGCAIPFVNADTFKRICDKRLVLESARSHGIAVPGQFELTPAHDPSALNGQLRFPLVVKPSRSVAGDGAERVSTGVSYAVDQGELLAVVGRTPRAAYPLLLQQRIDGPGFAISVFIWNGELKAAFAHRRIREKPPSGGVSVLRESIPIDEDLLNRSVALLRDFGWEGVAMVEYKLDVQTGIPYLMEINGRLWGSLQLALDAGVDFPVLLARAAMGERLPERSVYKVGVRSRWEWGDVDHLLATFRHSPRALSLSPAARRHRRLRALGGFLSSIGKTSETEVFDLADPAPFLRETRDWFRGR
jgi:predicted ATP-grasp superfamily ATP-dependent carboligase